MMRASSLFLLVALAACNTLPDLRREYPDQAFHLLQARHPDTGAIDSAAATLAAISLTVGTFDAAPACDDTSFVYRLDTHEYQSDYYERFFVHPSAHLADLTRQWLHDSGLFQSVVPDTSRLTSTHRLDALIQELHADYQDADQPVAVLTLQCFLTDLRPEAHALAWHGDLHEEVVLEESTPQALAAAWSEAMIRALVRLEEELATALSDGS